MSALHAVHRSYSSDGDGRMDELLPDDGCDEGSIADSEWFDYSRPTCWLRRS
jgi:hypothetical protein